MLATLKVFAEYQLYQLERTAKKSKNTIKETLVENYVFLCNDKSNKKNVEENFTILKQIMF